MLTEYSTGDKLQLCFDERPVIRGEHDRVPTPRGLVTSLLFHRDALRQVSGLIDVAAAADGDVIGQQLQRNHFE